MSTDPTAAQPEQDTGQAQAAQAQAQQAQEQQGQPSEEELRAAYEAEMSRISSADMILQATVSLLNIGGYRLGLARSAQASGQEQPAGEARDLEQVRDAIDGARALLPVLERTAHRDAPPARRAVSVADGLRPGRRGERLGGADSGADAGRRRGGDGSRGGRAGSAGQAQRAWAGAVQRPAVGAA